MDIINNFKDAGSRKY